jgi:hypothetical protein
MPSSNLRDLVSDLPGVIENLQKSIDSITNTLLALSGQRSAVSNDVMGVMTSASDDWTTWKASDMGTYQVSSWGSYGTSNLTEWWIYDPASRPYNNATNPLYVVYQSSDVTSAGPAEDNSEARQYDRQIEFPLSLDHIDDTFGISPGTYGIDEKIDALQDGKTLAENNEAKYTEVLKIYDKYNNYPPTGT